MQSDAQLKQLIQQVSNLVNVPVSEQTMNELIQAIKSSKMNESNMEQLMKMIMKKIAEYFTDSCMSGECGALVPFFMI